MTAKIRHPALNADDMQRCKGSSEAVGRLAHFEEPEGDLVGVTQQYDDRAERAGP